VFFFFGRDYYSYAKASPRPTSQACKVLWRVSGRARVGAARVLRIFRGRNFPLHYSMGKDVFNRCEVSANMALRHPSLNPGGLLPVF